MRLLLAALISVSLSACSTIIPLPKAGQPVPLAVSSDQNPEALWIVREVEISKSTGSGTFSNAVVYGLFACYRQPAAQAGPPQCYMANYSYKLEDLGWPGGLYMGTDGALKPIK